MSKEFGVIFDGCRKEALALLMKIDSRRFNTVKKSTRQEGEPIKVRGMQELRGLAIDMKFESSGPRTREKGKTTGT